MGRNRGGLSTKIHAICDVLGNPIGFYLTAGQAHDLDGVDALLPEIEAEALLAVRADDADERVRQRLAKEHCEAIIHATKKRKPSYSYDQEL
nr:transposase [[Leptolyngbya] sp. PCC 7376]